jgi:hypothetical protein
MFKLISQAMPDLRLCHCEAESAGLEAIQKKLSVLGLPRRAHIFNSDANISFTPPRNDMRCVCLNNYLQS